MPIYEYYCDACKKTFETLQPFGAKKPKKCECCGATAKHIKKMISESTVIYNTGGFYCTSGKTTA